MPPEPRDAAHLWDMLRTAKALAASVEGVGLEAYLEREDLRLTVERRLEIMGEAARRVSEGFRTEHPEIPWTRIIGLRNVLAHEYDDVDNERVWRVAAQQIAPLIQLLEPLVPPPPA